MTKQANPPKFIFLLNIGLRAIERWLDKRPNRLATRSSAQIGALFYLTHHNGALIGDVAQALLIGAPAMTGLANRMQQAGLISRRQDAGDGRAIRLFVTEQGELASRQAHADLAVLNLKLTEGFSEAEMVIVARWLEGLQKRFGTGCLDEN